MKDRLIELIDGFVLECVNNCPKIIEGTKECHKCAYGKIADYLIANGVVVPPCKVGQTVYLIKENKVCKGIVKKITVYEENVMRIDGKCWDDEKGVLNKFISPQGVFGKTVFLTREEAERALKRKDVGK